MAKRIAEVVCVALLLGVAALIAQTPPNDQTPPATATPTITAAAPSPEGMPGPGMPTGPNASADACADNFPDGGPPYFLYAETPERRKARLGTTSDPGCDPDPDKSFWRFGKESKIAKYDRTFAFYPSGGAHDLNTIRPFGFVNSYRELYQQNEKWVWVWQVVPEVQAPVVEDLRKSTQAYTRYSDADVTYLQNIRPEFFPLDPASTTKTIHFEESSQGLPTAGSWRNGLAIADMNGDGFPDIIAPPERGGGNGIPSIFLGDGKGHWHYWKEARWPHALDYGTVAAGDFNKDGHMDLAFAVHLRGIYVMLGDGKGNFTEVTEGLPRDFPTRRLLVTDVDHDGYPDIVSISEGPTAVRNAERTLGRIRVYYNHDKGQKWEGMDVASPQTRVGGDYLSVGNFTGSKYPDIVAGSVYQGSPDVVYLGSGPKVWSKLDSKVGSVIPFLSYYYASAAAKFTSKKTDDLILSYIRLWPGDVNEKLVPAPPMSEVTGIDRISFGADGPKRTPIVRWKGKFGITGLAAADIDGDGNLDIIYTTLVSSGKREVVVLLGDGKGNFSRAKIEGLTAPANTTYDLKVADVNGDGRPDVILMYEAGGSSAFSPRDGSIRVFLNRGAAPAPVADR